MSFFFHKKQNHNEQAVLEPAVEQLPFEQQQEIAAVIALALHKYINEVKDYEDAVLTFQKIMKPYSPWSSKIYGLRLQPVRMPVGFSLVIK